MHSLSSPSYVASNTEQATSEEMEAKPTYNVAVVGATGAVGQEIVACLHHRNFPVQRLRLFASERSRNKVSQTAYGDIQLEVFDVRSVRQADIAFLAVSGAFSEQYARALCAEGGPVVIDMSSAFRYDDNVPLVIPEINAHKLAGARLIANPNCTTAIAAVALWPLHREFGLRSIIMSTYQAASGAGAKGMEELLTNTRTVLEGGKPTNNVFSHSLAFNLIPFIDKLQPNGYSREEIKVALETRKIFGLEEGDVRISCTAVRVPITRVHSEAITIETHSPIDPERARKVLRSATGVELIDDPADNIYPMPISATGKQAVEVGRVRQSLVYGRYGLDLFVSGDQLLRGAALNAVLIAESLLDERLLATENAGYQGERAEQRQEVETRFTFVNGAAIGAVVGALVMALFTSSRRW